MLRLGGNPIIEKAMDLYNNDVGRGEYIRLLSKNLTGHYYNTGILASLINLKNNGGLR